MSVEKPRAKRVRARLSPAAMIVASALAGVGATAASSALADPATPAPASSSAPPDVSHPSRPALPADSSPRALARTLAAAGTTTPVVVDPAVSNTEANFATNDRIGGSEPSVALNPANPKQIAITSFSLGNLTWGANQNAPLWYTTDGGSTWTKEFTITHPPGRPEEGEGCPPCDQTIDYGRNGTLFGTFLIFGPNFVETGPPRREFKRLDVVSGDTTNPAQASSWQWNGNPAQLTNNAHPAPGANADQPWLLVNRDPTTEAQDDVWGAYDNFSTNPTTEQVAVSSNAAPPNFTVDNSPGQATLGGLTNPGLRLAKDPRNGAMYALWQTTTGESSPHPTTLHINRSTDAGANWTLNGSTGGQALPPGQADDGCRTFEFNKAKNQSECTVEYKFGTVNALRGGVHHLAVDPTNGDVYVAYGNDNAGTGEGNQLLIRRLTDDKVGGFIVGPAITVSNAASTALPSVAVTADGTVGVLYDTFDGLSKEGEFPRFSAHLAVSTDHGLTFSDTVLETFLSPSTSTGQFDTQRVLGDFQQLKANGDLLYGVFSGNRAPLNENKSPSIIDPIYFTANTGIAATGGFTVNATEGSESSPQTVATFTDPDPNSTAAEYSATIEWGDGGSSAGTISGPTGGPFTVSGTHTYAEEGKYEITVKIKDLDDAGNSATASSSAEVADAALQSACAAPPISRQAFAGATAVFTDGDPGGTSPPDYSATIEWGDSLSSSGTVSAGTGPGPYAVSGAHTYSSPGAFTITTTIKDAGGSQTVATCKTLVFAFYGGYVDTAANDHGSRSGHPTPWKGNKGVTFVGCGFGGKDSCPKSHDTDIYDAGAIRIDAPPSVALHVTGASATVGPCAYNPWPGLSVNIPAGGKLILTETGKHKCTANALEQDNFDTSESFLQSPQYRTFLKTKKCANDGYLPQITVTINGVPFTFTDTSQILNDRGIDPDICEKKSEFSPWTLIL